VLDVAYRSFVGLGPIPLIIACGSLSGFHSLVASGTTSKQLTSEKAGLPIGINAGTRYDTERKSLGPGDRILLFTDGIAESQAPDGTFFGIEGVKAFLARTSRMASREAVGELIAEVAGFSGKSQPLDDRTVFLATCNL